jgi:hypothetical protein
MNFITHSNFKRGKKVYLPAGALSNDLDIFIVSNAPKVVLTHRLRHQIILLPIGFTVLFEAKFSQTPAPNADVTVWVLLNRFVQEVQRRHLVVCFANDGMTVLQDQIDLYSLIQTMLPQTGACPSHRRMAYAQSQTIAPANLTAPRWH